MLPQRSRVRQSRDFSAAVRSGRRAGRRHLVVHLLTPDADASGVSARAGFVVSKAVGNSVVRHRVSRQLRHLVAARIGELPVGSVLVVRALPPAAGATSAELDRDLDAGLRRTGAVDGSAAR